MGWVGAGRGDKRGLVAAVCGGFSEGLAAWLVGWLGKLGGWAPWVVLLKSTEANRRPTEVD